MTPNALIVRYGEITLKGRNRLDFELRLKNDIERFLRIAGIPSGEVALQRGRIYIRNLATLPDLRKVLGIHSFSSAIEIPRDLSQLKKNLLDWVPSLGAQPSFRISCQRVDKTFPHTSMEVEREMGDLVREKTGMAVDLDKPALNIQIEIGPEHIYLFTDKIRGHSGFPYGSAGKLVALISGGIDSPVATFLMMKRGVEPLLLHFAVAPESGRKVARIRDTLQEYTSGNPIELMIIDREEIFQHHFQELFHSRFQSYLCVLCKYLMHRKACEIARQQGALGIITGDNLAQVASQTLPNLLSQRQADDLPVYSPLIAYEKEETMRLAREIGTYDLSIAPGPGCTPPPHPKTKVTPERLRQILRDTGLSDV